MLVIDDSAVFRELLAKELEKEPEFEVIGRAADPIIAKYLQEGYMFAAVSCNICVRISTLTVEAASAQNLRVCTLGLF